MPVTAQQCSSQTTASEIFSLGRPQPIRLPTEIVPTHVMLEELDKARLALVVEDQYELDHLVPHAAPS